MTLQEALAATHRNRPREPSMPSVLLAEAEALLERDR
jgi:hypothetical protein